MKIAVNTENFAILECFSSETRVKILEMLGGGKLNIKEMADRLGLSSAIVTKHVQKLEECGLIQTESAPAKRGMQKICFLAVDELTLQFRPTPSRESTPFHTVSIPIGQYVNYQVRPTCGLVSAEKRIGMADDPRYFADPEHVHAAHLWFGSGFVEYRIPNLLFHHEELRELEISMEIGSEAPGFNEIWPSDITFSINGQTLGTWTSPGDFGAFRGAYTPEWWAGHSQYGLLKTLSVNSKGSFIDGVRISALTIEQLSIHYKDEILFRIACHESAKHCGGVSLFGKRFGNYNQDIEVKMYYE